MARVRDLFVADVLAHPSGRVKTTALWRGWRAPREPVHWFVQQEGGWFPVGEGCFNGGRRSTVELQISDPGSYRVALGLGESKPQEVSVVSVVPPGRALFICDIDRTISNAAPWRANIGNPERIHPLPGAAEALGHLSETYAIVYVTARNWRFAGRTRRWLSYFEFPLGPVFHRPRVGWLLPSGRYKGDLLMGLVPQWPATRYAVGDRASDAWAYDVASLIPIILGPSRTQRCPLSTRFVKDWTEVMEIVEGTTCSPVSAGS